MPKKQSTILVCQGTGCVSGGSEQVFSHLRDEIGDSLPDEDIRVKRTGCHGFCQQGPLIVMEPKGLFYTKVKTDDIAEIIKSLSPGKKPVDRLFYRDPTTNKPIPLHHEIPFYSQQERTILKYCGNIDPEDINDYLAVDGYKALQKAVHELTPEGVISEVKNSGLRGLGGAGFPTGRKWEACRNAVAEKKYVVCNADEGDPGAFQDRSVMEGNPHSVIEGMIIAGYAT